MRATVAVFGLFVLLLLVACRPEGVHFEQAYVPLLPGDGPLAGYFTFVNDSQSPVGIISATSPAFAHVGMHRSLTISGTSRMESVGRVDVDPGEKLAFRPGGLHLMLMRRQRDLNVGDDVVITFRLAMGVEISHIFKVRELSVQ